MNTGLILELFQCGLYGANQVLAFDRVQRVRMWLCKLLFIIVKELARGRGKCIRQAGAHDDVCADLQVSTGHAKAFFHHSDFVRNPSRDHISSWWLSVHCFVNIFRPSVSLHDHARAVLVLSTSTEVFHPL